MTKAILFGLALIIALSCNKEDDKDNVRKEKGTVWLSGGLNYCAAQIRLDKRDTLVVTHKEIISFKSGDRVEVTYKEAGVNEHCPPFIKCEIIEMKKIE